VRAAELRDFASIAGNAWSGVLNILFAGICIRYVFAAVCQSYGDNWEVSFFATCVFALSIAAPFPILFGFVAALPLLAGLGQTSMLPGGPAALAFCSIWLGYQARTAWNGFHGERNSDRPASLRPQTAARVVLFSVNCLITVIAVSGLIQCWRNASPAFWRRFLSQPTFGYGDPLYFIEATFVWFQGLFFFRFLGESENCARFARFSSASHSREAAEIRAYQDAGETRFWLRPAFVAYAFVMSVFLCLQAALKLPEGWVAAGYFSPFEDISSFGSIAASLLVFGLITSRGITFRATLGGAGYCLTMLAMVALSWSRAAWLVTGIFLLVACWVRFSKKWCLAFIGLGAGLVLLGNLNADRPSWRSNDYLARFVSLVRLENPANKDAGRLNLYHKALGMIRARPWTGHLIGSFYLTSPKFASPSDPNASRPDFAHDLILQLATELGVPVAICFLGGCTFVVYRGLSVSVAKEQKSALGGEKVGTVGPQPRSKLSVDSLPLLGATLALAAYLTTQITANSLNVYASNQFFFWLLVAAIIFYPESKTRGEPGRGRLA
jgi:O-antigen ligase